LKWSPNEIHDTSCVSVYSPPGTPKHWPATIVQKNAVSTTVMKPMRRAWPGFSFLENRIPTMPTSGRKMAIVRGFIESPK